MSAYEANAPSVEVELRATEIGVRRLRGLERHGNRAFRVCDDPGADGWCRCTVAFESLEDAYDDVLLLGADVEVVKPEDLRDQVARNASALSAIYG